MDDNEVIDISSDESDKEKSLDLRSILEPVIGRVVDALGGYEDGVYRMGDEVVGCLKDLKKLWRKDDTDDERTVARIFWETRVLINDLIPILLVTAGKGAVEDKRAILCADLMTAMTWPIDMAEELKELDDDLDRGTDYTQLTLSHLHYKAALLKPKVMEALFGIMLPPLAKHFKERSERDGQIINVVLHLIRNLAFIKDLPMNSHLSADQAEFSSLQSKLIRTLSETHTFRLLLTIAANSGNDPLLANSNTLALEIFYLLYRGVKPSSLAQDQSKQPAENLRHLLATEQRIRQDLARKATSRHSRFGTTISVKLNPKKRPLETDDTSTAAPAAPESKAFILHRQQAINSEAGSIMDFTKKQKSKKTNVVDELAREDNLSLEARMALRHLAVEFLQACFNPFLSGLLKDIKSERPKITEKDNVRLLFVTKWFLEFFQSMRAKEETNGDEEKWPFGYIAEVTERSWIVWVLKRMREAVEEKPKLWTELQAGIECLTQLLLLIDKLSSSEIADSALADAAEVLQQQLIYNGEVLDIAYDSLRAYREGTQSLAYLDSSIYLAYALLRVLERWGKNQGGMYVRKKLKKTKKAKAIGEEDGIPDVEEEVQEVEDIIHETMFTFEAFEMKFAQSEITHTLLAYLARYKEFTSSEHMRRVVSLMHRQAVKAKAEGLYFKVSTLDLFKSILANQKSLPRDQPYKDLLNLINFILRKFFKALADDTFLAIEAYFPKNRGHWKKFSSWEPEEKSKREKKTVQDKRFPQDVAVKKGYSWSDQLGIAIACLVDAGKRDLVEWTKEILAFVTDQRQKIIAAVDDNDDNEDEGRDQDDLDLQDVVKKGPSNEAMSKLTDYAIPYLDDEHAEAASKNAELKLLFRLSKFSIFNEDGDELEWYVPAGITPPDLRSTLNVINQFLETPIDLDGKKPSELLGKKSRRRRRRRSPSPEAEDDAALSGDEPKRRKRKERQKQEVQYKSAQFIEDSDEEYGNLEAFLAKEEERRQRAQMAADAANKPITAMRPTGTKKRRKKGVDSPRGRKGKANNIRESQSHTLEAGDDSPTHSLEVSENTDESDDENVLGGDSGSSAGIERDDAPVASSSKPRPRPIGLKDVGTLTLPSFPQAGQGSVESPRADDDSDEVDLEGVRSKQRARRVVSSDEE